MATACVVAESVTCSSNEYDPGVVEVEVTNVQASVVGAAQFEAAVYDPAPGAFSSHWYAYGDVPVVGAESVTVALWPWSTACPLGVGAATVNAEFSVTATAADGTTEWVVAESVTWSSKP
jgi:hypothetical protein